MGPDAVHADGLKVVDRRGQTDRLGDGRGPGLEPLRRLGREEPVRPYVEDHAAAAEERAAWHRAARPGPRARRYPVGPSILWAEKARKSTPRVGYVHRQVGH